MRRNSPYQITPSTITSKYLVSPAGGGGTGLDPGGTAGGVGFVSDGSVAPPANASRTA